MTQGNTIVRPASPRLRGWRWIALLLALSQLVTPPVISRVFGDFLSSGATNDAVITPAGYAFALWGLITALSSITAVAVVRLGLGAPWETRAMVDGSIAFAGFSIWLVIAAQDWLWVTVIVFAVMVAALIDVTSLLVRRADDLTCPVWLRRLATLSFGLYLGWSSVAVFVNVAAALLHSGWSASETSWQAVILALATAAAIALSILLRGTLGYVAAVAWALLAVVIGAVHRGSTIIAIEAATAGTLIIVTAAAVHLGASRR